MQEISKKKRSESVGGSVDDIQELRVSSTIMPNSKNVSDRFVLSFSDKDYSDDSMPLPEGSKDPSKLNFNSLSLNLSNFNSAHKNFSMLNSNPFGFNLYKDDDEYMEGLVPGALSNKTLEYMDCLKYKQPVRPITGNKNLFEAGIIGDKSSYMQIPFSNPYVYPAFEERKMYPKNSLSSLYPNVPLEEALHKTLEAFSESEIRILEAMGLQINQSNANQRFQYENYNDFSKSSDLFALRHKEALNTLLWTTQDNPHRAANLYRNAAKMSEPNITWSGTLPHKTYHNPTYSTKVFLGGTPWDISEIGLQSCFKHFGPLRIEWPNTDSDKFKDPLRNREHPGFGYVYILFDYENSVKDLINSCVKKVSQHGISYFYNISSRKMKSKPVQVIPWVTADSNFTMRPTQRLQDDKQIFVGALHGMMTAKGLATIMNDLFGNVVHAGIDTDRSKYPIGSGRVSFSSDLSFKKAVEAAFITVKTSKFIKKIQVDPYLGESSCLKCHNANGIFFCRDFNCSSYFCENCWRLHHMSKGEYSYHKPLMKNPSQR